MNKNTLFLLISFNSLFPTHDKIIPINSTENIPNEQTSNIICFTHEQHVSVISAVSEALKNRDVERQKTKKYFVKLSKKQVTCFAAVAGLITATITTITALIITFSNCSKS